jgi:hypothetical protein
MRPLGTWASSHKLRYNDFSESTRSRSLEEPTDLETDIYSTIAVLVSKAWELVATCDFRFEFGKLRFPAYEPRDGSCAREMLHRLFEEWFSFQNLLNIGRPFSCIYRKEQPTGLACMEWPHFVAFFQSPKVDTSAGFGTFPRHFHL